MAYRVVFLVGAQRSGTTWLQRLLGAHPAVASTQETDLFNRYVRLWWETWQSQLADNETGANGRQRGLPVVLTTEEFAEVLRSAVGTVYQKVADLKPSASVVLDKNPGYSLHVPLLQRVLPEARFIHIIRDGRDVAASLMAAADGWGRAWAPRDADAAGRRWRRQVATARDAAPRPEQYLEVRYEHLLADGPGTLASCLAFCGVEATVAECSDICAELAFAKARKSLTATSGTADPLLWSGEVANRVGGAPPEPEGFFRKGTSQGWRQDWTAIDRWAFDRSAGDLLVELGYEPDRAWARSAPLQRAAFRPLLLGHKALGRARRQLPQPTTPSARVGQGRGEAARR
jgi:hypothetical protein